MSNIAFVFSLLIVRGLSAHKSPRHSTAENDADTVATLEISLDPPAVPFPVAQHDIDRMETKRERLEASGMRRLLGAFAAAKETARKRLGGIVQHAMYSAAAAASHGATFLEARESFVPHTAPAPRTTARVQVYAPDMGGGAEIGLKALEQHRSDAEGPMIEEAIASMAGITDMVCDALEVGLRGWIEDVSVRRTPIQRQEATSFGHVRAMSFVEKIGAARAVPVHNSIKIIRPAEFLTIASLAGGAEARRGLAESLLAWKTFHLQLRLLREEYEIARGLLEQAWSLYASGGRR